MGQSVHSCRRRVFCVRRVCSSHHPLFNLDTKALTFLLVGFFFSFFWGASFVGEMTSDLRWFLNKRITQEGAFCGYSWSLDLPGTALLGCRWDHAWLKLGAVVQQSKVSSDGCSVTMRITTLSALLSFVCTLGWSSLRMSGNANRFCMRSEWHMVIWHAFSVSTEADKCGMFPWWVSEQEDLASFPTDCICQVKSYAPVGDIAYKMDGLQPLETSRTSRWREWLDLDCCLSAFEDVLIWPVMLLSHKAARRQRYQDLRAIPVEKLVDKACHASRLSTFWLVWRQTWGIEWKAVTDSGVEVGVSWGCQCI